MIPADLVIIWTSEANGACFVETSNVRVMGGWVDGWIDGQMGGWMDR